MNKHQEISKKILYEVIKKIELEREDRLYSNFESSLYKETLEMGSEFIPHLSTREKNTYYKEFFLNREYYYVCWIEDRVNRSKLKRCIKIPKEKLEPKSVREKLHNIQESNKFYSRYKNTTPPPEQIGR